MSDRRIHQLPWRYILLVGVFVVSLLQIPLLYQVSPSLIRGDGVGYYAFLRSTLLDKDLDFQNEYEHFHSLFQDAELPLTSQLLTQRTPTGLVPNHWPVGPAILWSPWWILSHGAVQVANQIGLDVAADGYSMPYQIAVALGSATYGFLGILLVYQLSCRYFSRRASIVSVFMIWFATSLTAYMYFMGSMAHACSFFCTALFLCVWQRGYGSRSVKRAIGLGLLTGLMALQRYQDVILAVVLAPEAFSMAAKIIREKRWREMYGFAVQTLCFAMAAILAFSPQLAVWRILYGQFFVQPYAETREEVMNWLAPDLMGPLFSSHSGLITWTPVTGIGLVGLYWLWQREQRIATSLVVAFLATLYVIASFPNWPGDASFGARYFISALPIIALGLCGVNERLEAYQRGRILSVVLTAILSLWNYLLLSLYGTAMIPRSGAVSWADIIQIVFVRIPLTIFDYLSK